MSVAPQFTTPNHEAEKRSTHNGSGLFTLLDRRSVQVVLLAILLVVACVLRFQNIGTWSLWIDESITMGHVEHDFSGDPLTDALHNSVSIALIRLTTDTWGFNEAAARFIPVLFGLASLLALYWVTHKLYGFRTALIATSLLTISVWHVYFSQNIRYFSALMLLNFIAAFAFYYGYHERRRGLLVLGFVFLLVGYRERQFAYLLLPVLLMYLFLINFPPFSDKRRRLPLVLMALIVVIPAAFYAANELLAYAEGASRFTGMFINWFVNNETIAISPLHYLDGLTSRLGWPVVVLALYATAMLIRRKDRLGLFIGLNAFVPIIGLAAFAIIGRVTYRYTLTIEPFIYLLAALGIRELYRQIRGGNFLAPLAMMTAVLATLLLDRQMIDMHFYLGSNVVLLMVILFALVIVLLAALRLRRNKSLDPVTVTLVMLFPIYVYLGVGVILYHNYEGGWRPDWKGTSAAIIAAHQGDEPVYTELTYLAGFYHVPDLVVLGSSESNIVNVTLADMLADNTPFWFVESNLIHLLYENLPSWIDQYCRQTYVGDAFYMGENDRLRLQYCQA